VTRGPDSQSLGEIAQRFILRDSLSVYSQWGDTSSAERDLFRWVETEFLGSPEYLLSCSFVAAAMGSGTEYKKLLEWAVGSSNGLKAITSLHSPPHDPTEAAALAIAKGQFDDKSVFVKGSERYLLAFIESYFDNKSSFRPAKYYQQPISVRSRITEQMVAAIDALPNLDARTTAPRLRSLVWDLDLKLWHDPPEDYLAPVLVAAIGALERFGFVCTDDGQNDFVGFAVKNLGGIAGDVARKTMARVRCQ
jgi:hypothetical protein